MRIIQILPVLAYGDAIGNDTVALRDALLEAGYKTEIYAEVIDGRLPQGTARQVEELTVDKDDVLLYHLSTCSDLNYKLEQYDCKRMILYHNITPPVFFKGINREVEKNCEDGLAGARHLAQKVEYALADSEYNKKDLINMGYSCKIDVLPILIAFDDYGGKPDKKVLNKYNDGYTNVIFTGRVAPNKKQEDVIRAFHFYHKYLNPESRLFIVGSYTGMEQYYGMLKDYVKRLDIEDSVYFTGHIKFKEILAYYHLADLFLCMSEHEGFCVPLVEAMYFKVPVIAYHSSAVGETLGGSGFLLEKKDPVETAMAMKRIMEDEGLRNTIIANEQARLQDFSHVKIKEKFYKLIEENINEVQS